ncbi:MAG: NAD-dependent epimerase/dehydratase family protein [Hyphomicrobiaceae bacterium]
MTDAVATPTDAGSPLVLVTGAGGLVGRSVVAALAKADVRVVACGRTPKPLARLGVASLTWDVLDTASHAQLVRRARFDTIVHLAWTTAHGRFWDDPENLDWCGATLSLARAAREAGVRRFVGIGSCVEYGALCADKCREDEIGQLLPHTLYGTAKDATHRVISAFARRTGMSFAWARLFNVTGPGEPPAKLLSHVVIETLAGRTPAIREPARHVDLIDCRDAGAAIARLARSSVEGAVNIGSGRAVRAGDLSAYASAVLDLPTDGELQRNERAPLSLAARPYAGLIAHTQRLSREVGFRPHYTLADTMRAIASGIEPA